MRYAIVVLLWAVCLVACGNGGAQKRSKTQAGRQAVPQNAPAAEYGYKVVRAYPHDTRAYTQGLFWHDGTLWESTGEYGRSAMRQVTLETGEVTRQTALRDDFFGEGAALLDGKIYQLTWLEKTGFIYDTSLNHIGRFTYKDKEGWGLTTDGTKLYMSDGSANITVRNPADFAVTGTIAVCNAGRPVQMLNELEWIDGRIWANVYMSQQVVIIDPASGNVEGTVDFTGLVTQLTIAPDTDVMNGIAHDPATGRTWVTGKKWDRLFEVEVFKK